MSLIPVSTPRLLQPLITGNDRFAKIPNLATVRKHVKGFFFQPKFPIPLFPFQFNPNTVTDRKQPNYAQIQIPGLNYPRYAYSHSGPRTIEFTLYMYGYEQPSTIDRVMQDFLANGVDLGNAAYTLPSLGAAGATSGRARKAFRFNVGSFIENTAIQLLAPGLIPSLAWLHKLRGPTEAANASTVTAKFFGGRPQDIAKDGVDSNFQFSAPPLVLFSFGAMSFLGGSNNLGLIPCVVRKLDFTYSMFNRQLAPVIAEATIVLDQLEQDEYLFFRERDLI